MIGETFNHYGIIRMRVLGSGILRLKFMSLPDDNGVQTNIDISDVTLPHAHQFPTVLADCNAFGVQLEIRMSDLDDKFNLSMLSIYVVPTATQLPS